MAYLKYGPETVGLPDGQRGDNNLGGEGGIVTSRSKGERNFWETVPNSQCE